MIGRIRGIIVEKKPPHLLIDVHGLGYELEAPMSTFYQLPDVATEVSLYTHLVVREDAHLLYGFSSETERKLFRTLLKVNGVGARMALTILSGCEVNEFVECIQKNDKITLMRLPGVGKKTAERLILEMRDAMANWSERELAGTPIRLSMVEPAQDDAADAVSALVALGYKPPEALQVINSLKNNGLSRESLIREALRTLARVS